MAGKEPVDGERHRRQAVFGGDRLLLRDLGPERRQALAALGGVDQLGAQLADDALEGLGEPFVEGGVLLDPLLDLRPQRMLHERGAGLIVGEALDLLLEVLIEDGDGRHEFADARVDARVEQLLHLRPDGRPVDVGALPQALGRARTSG